MSNAAVLCAALVVIAVYAGACSGPPTLPTSTPTSTPQSSSTPSPTSQPPTPFVPSFPAVPGAARVYAAERFPYIAYPHGSELASRFVLRDDGSFGLQYSSLSYSFFEYKGTYTEQNGNVTLAFHANNGRWTATARFRRDRVSQYNLDMQMSDFEDGYTFGFANDRRLPPPGDLMMRRKARCPSSSTWRTFARASFESCIPRDRDGERAVLHGRARGVRDRAAHRALPAGAELISSRPTEGVAVYFDVALMGGLVLSAPAIMYQVWLFVAPALYAHEKRFVIPFVSLAAVGSVAGAAFSHYVLFPGMMSFFATFSISEVKYVPRLEYVWELYVRALIGMVAVFQIPTLAFFLTKLRIVTAKFLWRNIKYSILIIFVVAAGSRRRKIPEHGDLRGADARTVSDWHHRVLAGDAEEAPESRGTPTGVHRRCARSRLAKPSRARVTSLTSCIRARIGR